MGGSSKQVTGYRYFANFLLFIGNPIEKVLGINFDKRGWLTPLIDDLKNPLDVGEVNKPSIYGENEGGVKGFIHARYGTANPDQVSFYTDYLAENDFPPLAYPFLSYLAFKDFYLGNSGYMKEMLLWPKRTRIRNDGQEQWYKVRDDDTVVCEIGAREVVSNFVAANDIPPFEYSFSGYEGFSDYPGFMQGIYAHSGSDAYGGVTNPSITNTMFFIAQGEQIEKFDVVTIMIHARGLVEKLEYEYVNISKIYKQEILREKGDLEQSLIIEITCKSNGQFPYVIVTGTGTIELDPVTHGYSWGISSLTKVADDFIFQDDNKAYDINPIHKIREILTDDTAMNKPESDVNDVNFIKAADRIWDEGLGVSWVITEKSCLDAINELCSHIEAGIRINRQTGLYEIVLFRDDWFEEDEIHSLAENKIKSISFEVKNADDVINKLNVSYYDRENIKDASFSISENASIKNLNGHVNAQTSDFPYFMNQRNAAVVAQWKLKQLTTSFWKGTFTTGFDEARKWNRYDIVKINWSKKGIVDLPVRIMSINLGDGINNTVSIDFVEVVPYSDQLTSTVVIDGKIDTAPLPPQPALFKAFELSYFEAVQAQGQNTVDSELAHNSDIGYVAVFAQRPQNNSLNALLYTDAGAGYEKSATVQYCETAELDQAIDRISSTFVLKRVGNIDDIQIGSQIFINDEIMVYQAFNSTTSVLTVKRGALDTIPQTHDVDSVLFFSDDFVSIDQTEYANGEIVSAKVVTTTPSGVFDIDAVTAQSIEIQSRAIRPYPPANVKINDEYWPLEYDGSINFSWAHRNRVQQTGGVTLGFYDEGVTIESDTTYLLIVFEIDSDGIEYEFFNQNIGFVDAYSIDLSTLLNTTKSIRFELSSIRDGFASFSAVKHTMFASFNPPNGLTAAYTDGVIQLNWEFEE